MDTVPAMVEEHGMMFIMMVEDKKSKYPVHAYRQALLLA